MRRSGVARCCGEALDHRVRARRDAAAQAHLRAHPEGGDGSGAARRQPAQRQGTALVHAGLSAADRRGRQALPEAARARGGAPPARALPGVGRRLHAERVPGGDHAVGLSVPPAGAMPRGRWSALRRRGRPRQDARRCAAPRGPAGTAGARRVPHASRVALAGQARGVPAWDSARTPSARARRTRSRRGRAGGPCPFPT